MEFVLNNERMQARVRTLGGELVSLTDQKGTEYLWNGDPAYWAGVNPILFPIIGGLKEGKVMLDGESWEMKRHGFARDQEFSVIEQTEDSICLELKDSKETRSVYPRSFQLKVRHQLDAEGFSTSFEVCNRDTRRMPFCIGAHTAFRCPLHAGEAFEDYELVFNHAEEAGALLLDGQGCVLGNSEEKLLDGTRQLRLEYSTFEKLDTIIFKNLKSQGVSLQHRESGEGIHVEYSGFPIIAFWTPGAKRAPFLCIEPWHGCAAAKWEKGTFEEKEGCILLEPGEQITLGYSVKVLTKL